ncbi:MAG: hypothetical protein JWM64_2724 [Frankiales bacterium]|nr:hypothetical protein [Frankiales bacterium]
MPRRKRADYRAPSVRPREPRLAPAATPDDDAPVSYFPPGTWRKVLLGGGIGAAGLVALFLASLLNDSGDRAQEKALTRGSCTVDARTDPGSAHVASPAFRTDPPAGGDHLDGDVAPGTYAGADVPPDGALVHAMAQGRVVLWHRPGVGTTEAADLVRAHRKDVVVVERASLPVPLALTAWHSRLLCQAPEPAVLERFTDTRKGSGPEQD